MTDSMTMVEKKLSSLQAWVIAGLSFILVLAVSGVAGAAWISSNNQARVARALQESNAALACYILPQIDRATKTLPTITYYRDHPDELQAQLLLLQAQRDEAIDVWGDCPADT